MNLIIGSILSILNLTTIVIIFLLVREVKKRKKMFLNMLKETVLIVDEKDPYFNGHSRRVAENCKRIAKQMKFSNNKIHMLEVSIYISEIGKIKIPDEIITKREKLTDKDFEIVKKHPIVAQKMVRDIEGMEKISEIVRAHHEKYDGSGYPDNFVSDSIPIESRIIAVADAFDAMISERPYKKALTEVEAINELEKNKEKQFDPKIVDIFKEVIGRRRE